MALFPSLNRSSASEKWQNEYRPWAQVLLQPGLRPRARLGAPGKGCSCTRLPLLPSQLWLAN